jgi:hypothetical protein
MYPAVMRKSELASCAAAGCSLQPEHSSQLTALALVRVNAKAPTQAQGQGLLGYDM